MFERPLCRRKLSELLASDAGTPAPRRPAARTASWGEVSEGGRSPPPRSGRRDPDLRVGEHDRGRAGPVGQVEMPAADPRHPQLSPEQLAEVRRLQSLYPDKRGALLPVLQLAQGTFGYVSLELEEYVAKLV